MLHVEDLYYKAGEKPLFCGLSFTVKKGEAWCIHGPNGSGKTTLLRLIAGLCVPDKGTIRSTHSGTHYLGHRNALKPALTVRENLKFWAKLYGASEKDYTKALAAFSLEEFQDMPVHILSAGWQRKVPLARVLLSGARLWLLDEPTAHLDIKSTVLIEKMIKDHCKKGGVALVTSHAKSKLATRTLELGEKSYSLLRKA